MPLPHAGIRVCLEVLLENPGGRKEGLRSESRERADRKQHRMLLDDARQTHRSPPTLQIQRGHLRLGVQQAERENAGGPAECLEEQEGVHRAGTAVQDDVADLRRKAG